MSMTSPWLPTTAWQAFLSSGIDLGIKYKQFSFLKYNTIWITLSSDPKILKHGQFRR